MRWRGVHLEYLRAHQAVELREFASDGAAAFKVEDGLQIADHFGHVCERVAALFDVSRGERTLSLADRANDFTVKNYDQADGARAAYGGFAITADRVSHYYPNDESCL